MDFGTQEQDTASFDSYVSRAQELELENHSKGGRGGGRMTEDYFDVLSLMGSIQRTATLCRRHGPRLVRWATMTMIPSFLVAALTAISHTGQEGVQIPIRLTPFDELKDDLPLVLWHLTVWMVGTTVAIAVIVRYIAETVYASQPVHTPYHASVKATVTSCSRFAILLAAGAFMLLSLAVPYLVGHVLTVGLADLRRDANAVRHKNPFVFGSMEAASWIMTIAVDATAVFGVVWMSCMYGQTIPIIVLLEPQSRTDPVEVFRQAYVLARDSRSYLVATWTVAALPAILITCFVTWPLYVMTRNTDGRQDFVEWQFGTLTGIIALYLPMMTVWLPLFGM